MSEIRKNILQKDDLKTESQGAKFVKFSPLPKPDFSSIEQKESNFTYKQIGSYKKPKTNIPESPMKSPNQKYYTPVKTQSNLFGNMSTCRKLNFGAMTDEPGGCNNNPLIEKFEEEEFSPTPTRAEKGERKVSKLELICVDVEMEDYTGDKDPEGMFVH
jgi:hypothetical protein